MAIRRIVLEGDSILEKKSKVVESFDKKLASLIDDLIETNKKYKGVGIAAPQVGILKRVAIIDIDNKVIELVNPVITEFSGEQIKEEGCLSIPNFWSKTSRPKLVSVKAQNRFGEKITYKGKDLKARALCHEIDHLDGILFRQRVI